MAEQYTSIKVIQEELSRKPFLKGITLDAVLNYTAEFMRIVGTPNMFINKVVRLSTDNYKVKLPCDYVQTVQLRGIHGVYRKSTDIYHLSHQHAPEPHSYCGNGCVVKRDTSSHCYDCPNQPTCDEYLFDYNKVECICMLRTHTLPSKSNYGNYYVTQNSYIYLSNRCDTVDLSYYALLTDSDGYTMVPDDAKFIRALKAYIKKEYYTDLFDQGTISDKVMFKADQDYAWAVGACESGMKMVDLPDLEVLSNAMHGMINKNNEFMNSFESNGDPVIFKTH